MKNLELVYHVETQEILEEYTKNIHHMVQGNPWYEGSNNYTQVSLRVPVFSKKERLLIIKKSKYKKCSQSIMRNRLITEDTSYTKEYPKLMTLLTDIAHKRNGFLSRVSLVSTKNEEAAYPHIDCGYFYAFHARYHFVLFSSGSKMQSHEEVKVFNTGDIFFINNNVVHYGLQVEKGKERIHVFFDLLPKNPFIIIKMYCKWLFVYVWIKGHYNYSFWKRILGFPYLIQALYLSLFTYSHSSNT